MSFNVEARKVRDASLPHGRRLMAFARCIGGYSPIGFQATWAFLEVTAGNLRSDPDALLRALDLVTESRRRRNVENREYGARRRAAKVLGRRQPKAGESSPDWPPRWHAAPEEAATFAFEWDRRRHEATGWPGDQFARRVLQLLDGAIRSEDEAAAAALTEASGLLAPRLTSSHYETDANAYFTARRLDFLSQHVRVMLGWY